MAETDGGAQAFTASKPLLPAVCEFNHWPNRYAHDSWLGALTHGELLCKLRHNQRAAPRLARYLLDQLGLYGRYCFNFGAPRYRVALLAPEPLTALVRYAGLCLEAPRVRQAVLRDEVLRLRKFCGDDGYEFVFQRAADLTPPALLNAARPEDRSPDLRADILTSGLRCLAVLFTDADAALTRRLLLKLPRAWQPGYAAPAHLAGELAAVITLFEALLRELKLTEVLDDDQTAAA